MFWNLIPKTSPKFEPSRTWFNTRKEKLSFPPHGFLENRKINGKPIYESVKIGGKTVRKKESYEFTIQEQSLMMLGGIYDV